MLPDKILPPYPDEEQVVMDLVKAWFSFDGYPQTVYTGTETLEPPFFEQKLPFVRVGRVGGSPAEHTDRPVVDVDVFARTRKEAKALANDIQQLLLATPHPIDACRVLMSPQKVEWVEGSSVRRFYASYHLALRRHAS